MGGTDVGYWICVLLNGAFFQDFTSAIEPLAKQTVFIPFSLLPNPTEGILSTPSITLKENNNEKKDIGAYGCITYRYGYSGTGFL